MSDINLNTGAQPELIWVDIDDIIVDHNYQREIKPQVVARILREFSWPRFGALSLARQPDGKYAVVDGQHRLAAAKHHPRVSAVPAAVFQASGMIEEASVFLGINTTRTAVTTVERFWAGITAGDAAMLRIRDVLAKADCEVVATPGPPASARYTNAVSAVGRSIEKYGDSPTTKAAMTLKAAWPKDHSALAGVLIQALARIYRNNKAIDPERLVGALKTRSRHQLSADAEAIRKISGGAAETALTKTLVEIYNRGLSKNLITFGVAA